jgi:outer membrane protein TolC
MANVGLRLDVPLFQGNYYRALKQKNQLLLDAAHYEQEQTEAQLTRQQADWFAQYTEAFKKNEELKEKVTASGENLKIANLSMREGVMEFDEYNEIFREYNRARIEYLQNLADGILYHLLSTQKF